MDIQEQHKLSHRVCDILTLPFRHSLTPSSSKPSPPLRASSQGSVSAAPASPSLPPAAASLTLQQAKWPDRAALPKVSSHQIGEGEEAMKVSATDAAPEKQAAQETDDVPVKGVTEEDDCSIAPSGSAPSSVLSFAGYQSNEPSSLSLSAEEKQKLDDSEGEPAPSVSEHSQELMMLQDSIPVGKGADTSSWPQETPEPKASSDEAADGTARADLQSVRGQKGHLPDLASGLKAAPLGKVIVPESPILSVLGGAMHISFLQTAHTALGK